LKILFPVPVVLLLVSAMLLPATAYAAAGGQAVTLQLNWKHPFQFAGYYAAIERGDYREAGFDVQLQDVQEGREPIDTVLTGKVNAAPGYSTDEPYLLQKAGVAFNLFSPRASGIDF
jgi:ABC-type nitrate/sulfonate/bicarbonate transport system substrate-binding protein